MNKAEEEKLDFLADELEEAHEAESLISKQIVAFGRERIRREENNLPREEYDTYLTKKWEEAAKTAMEKRTLFNSFIQKVLKQDKENTE